MSTTMTATLSRTAMDFDALYRAARDDVYAYVGTLLRDRGAAEDVTAQAFERAYRKRGTYRASKGSERAWLFGIARNAALDELRRRSRSAPLLVDLPDEEQPTAQDEAELAVKRTAVRAALAQLAPRDREIVALRHLAGLGNAEAAKVLGISDSNAGTLLHRAMTALREACDDAL